MLPFHSCNNIAGKEVGNITRATPLAHWLDNCQTGRQQIMLWVNPSRLNIPRVPAAPGPVEGTWPTPFIHPYPWQHIQEEQVHYASLPSLHQTLIGECISELDILPKRLSHSGKKRLDWIQIIETKTHTWRQVRKQTNQYIKQRWEGMGEQLLMTLRLRWLLQLDLDNEQATATWYRKRNR